MNRALPLLAATLVFSGCVASPGRYPSLERRPAERITGSAAAVAPDVQALPDAEAPSVDLAAHVAQLVEQARAGHRIFTGKQDVAQRAVAAAGAFGTESWATASTALAEIESAQDPALQALAELDQIEADRQVDAAGALTGDIATVLAARAEVSRIVEQETAVVGTLSERIAG